MRLGGRKRRKWVEEPRAEEERRAEEAARMEDKHDADSDVS
jgi:hypothetical protein